MTDAGARRRALGLAVVALAGFAISAYLTAFQVGLVAHVWDPVFGDGSELVLTSGVSRILPIPDAALGALVYLVDASLAFALALGFGPGRSIARALMAITSLGAVVALGLVVLQPIVAGSFCSLCLTSAAISVVLVVGALRELLRDRDRADASAADRARNASRGSHHLEEVHR